jgi:adenylate cyclase
VTACVACGSAVEPGFAFCPRCGARQPVPCPGCGVACPPDFRFCPRCGTPLAGAPSPAGSGPPPGLAPVVRPPAVEPPRPAEAEADRRLVTVLFADLAGFTALATRLDPEDVRALQLDLFRELTGPVKEFGGFVEKYVGDAVMAVFGAPLAHEDDPERALRAALAMHARIAVVSARWASRVGGPLALHVGVNTGPVVAGRLGGAAEGAYAVTGDTVNTASRLLAAAPAGETLVARATYLLTQHAFAFEPLPDLTVRGKPEPLAVYRLRAARAARRSPRGLEVYGLVAPRVGRDQALGQLLAAVDRMLGGRAQVVSLVGEAGIGKSRLLRDLLAALAERGDLATTTVRQATCSPLGERPYGIVASFLQQAYGVTPDDPLEAARAKVVAGLQDVGGTAEEAAVVGALVGHVLGLEAARAPSPDDDPEQLRRRIFLAARTLFERRLARGPLLLVVEDLQWADGASVELLRFLVDRLAERQLMLLVTHRPDVGVASLVGGRASHTSLRLEPLSPAESTAILRAWFGGALERWPAPLRDVVVARAGGNPFYLEEVVRGLIEAGVLAREEDGQWRAEARAGAIDVPPTLQALLLARLDRLPAPARRVLQEAAVLGHAFEARLLRAVASEPADCEAQLEALVDAELLEEVPSAEGRYRFRHALVQEVVYQNLLQRRRTELHGRAGLAVEGLVGGRPERLEELETLGRHFTLGADPARGARYLIAAGERARAIYANEDALRHYQRALETLEACEGAEADRLFARERLGDVLAVTGARDAAQRHYEAVIQGLAAAGDAPGQARVHRKLGSLHWHGGHRDRARQCCEAGLALLAAHPRHIERAHLYQEMGRMAFRAGDDAAAREWAERALAHAQELVEGAGARPDGGDDAGREVTLAVIHAYNTLGIALARAGRPADGVTHIERSAALAEAQGLVHAACRSYANLGVLYSSLDPGRAIETCRRGLELAKRTGDAALQSRLYANLAVAYCALTNRCDDDGIGAARTAIDLDRRLGQLDHLAVPLIVLAQIYQCHGQPRLALTCYQEALELAEQAGDPQLLFSCYDGLAALHLEMGSDAAADEYMQKAQDLCERTGLDADSLVVLPFLE